MDETPERLGIETVARPGPRRVPRHVALVLGGEEAWGRLGPLPDEEAHRVSRRVLVPLLGFAGGVGIGVVTLCVSPAGERGPRRSAQALLGPLVAAAGGEVPAAGAGDRGGRRPSVRAALDHSGRGEVVEAVRGLLAAGVYAEEIDEAAFARHLSAPETPEVDLMVVTGEGGCLPDALLWQAAYAEFHFTGAPWPDLSVEELGRALASYAGRSRRRGGI